MSSVVELGLELHGPTAAAHELHSGRAGDFEAAMAALRRAQQQRRSVVVVSRLTRSNCRSLVDLVDRLVAARVAGWVLRWPSMPPDAHAEQRAAQSVVPRLGIAVPHALRAVKRATERGVPVALVGLPLCVLGPFAAHRLSFVRPSGEYPEVCTECPARSQCSGIEAGYLRRFGAQELRTVERIVARSLSAERVEVLTRALVQVESGSDEAAADVDGETLGRGRETTP